jgi:pyruvate/2-oxoglutarate dehydrogenase complex dihydrolipoamide acyltransferase (E2) component
LATTDNHDGFNIEPFTLPQRQMIDWLDLMQRRHIVHALLEIDITAARRAIHAYRRNARQRLSLTTFVVSCVARAVADDPQMHAYRRGRKLVLFDDVDIAVLVEREIEGKQIPIPYIVRGANRKSLAEIEAEIHAAQRDPLPYSKAQRLLPLWLLVPRFLRRAFWRAVLHSPHRRKRITGTVTVTAIHMFGRGWGWGLPLTYYTLCVTLGGVSKRPRSVRSDAPRELHVEEREFLALTLSVDHDVVNGAPAARFASRLRELIENVGEIPTAAAP